MSSQPYKLIAAQPARIDSKVVYRCPYWCVSIAKWIFTTTLAVLILCGAVVSRMALVAIPHSKSEPRFENGSSLAYKGEEGTPANSADNDEYKFLTLVVILMVPYAVEFFRCSWLHGFVCGHPWPSKVAIASGIVVSIIEVFGICYFTIAVLTLPELSSTERILFMNGVFILPSLKNLINQQNRRSRLNIFAFVTVFFNLGGIAWAIYKFSATKTRIALPVSIMLLNIAWFSPIRRWQSKPYRDVAGTLYNPVLVNDVTPTSSTDRLTEFNHLLSSSFVGRATLKSGILTSAFKLVAVPFVSMLFCHLYKVANLHHVSSQDIGPSMGFYWHYLCVNVLCSVAVYLVGILACSMGVQQQAFVIPLLLVTPICLFLSSAKWACDSTVIRSFCGDVTGSHNYHVLIIAVLLWLGVVCYVVVYIRKPQLKQMAAEKNLFVVPYSYNGVFLEQYMMLNREDPADDRAVDLWTYSLNQAKVFLCTTVYREDSETMGKYLECLSRVHSSQRSYNSIETHIVLDDAFTAKGKLNAHARDFISLCKDVLRESDASTAKLARMPYGGQIVLKFEDGTFVYLHFKDTSKVKGGKRWSQMMIMSWVLDTKRDTINELSNAYFVTSDVDVSFTSSSIERMLELMVRKPHVGGATCRVHADGAGPVVWYQMFEYAIWHWLVKAANSVIGSLINCTGCFSVFRLQALSDVQPVFARPTTCAADYLQRDLGEDRWLSCLLLKSGWLLDYCSLAEVSTMCPESFDDFFQQRRHWIVSSFANTCTLIKDFKNVRHFNNKLSIFYFIYLIATVFFMLVSPTVLIWMFAGTSYYIAGSIPTLISIGLSLMSIMLIYMAACLFTYADFHRAIAKGLSYVLSIAVFVLAILALVHVLKKPKQTAGTDDPPHHLDKDMGISVSLLYLIIYGGVFVVTALIHPKESYCCLQSLWYLMCLPAFNIFLVPYSVCNIHKMNSELEAPDDNVGWYLRFLKIMCRGRGKTSSVKNLWCSCCSTISESTAQEAGDTLLDQVLEASSIQKTEKLEEEKVEVDVCTSTDEEDETEDLEDQEIVDIGVTEGRQYWEQLQNAFLLPGDQLSMDELRSQLCHIRNGALLVFSIANILWFIVDFGAVMANPLGFASLTLFTILVIFQFVAMLYHRLITAAYELSQATFIPAAGSERHPRELSSPLYQQGNNPPGSFP